MVVDVRHKRSKMRPKTVGHHRSGSSHSTVVQRWRQSGFISFIGQWLPSTWGVCVTGCEVSELVRQATQDSIVCDVQDRLWGRGAPSSPARPTVVDSDSDVDDERLRVGSAGVGDSEVFAVTDASSDHEFRVRVGHPIPWEMMFPRFFLVCEGQCSAVQPLPPMIHKSVDGEEVDLPSSDTETVGGVSDVSFDASSSSVFPEQELVVDEVIVGLAVRGLDALDIP